MIWDKAGLERQTALLLMRVRRRASRSPTARTIYFALRRLRWRVIAMSHLVIGLLRSTARDTRMVRVSGCFDSVFYMARYGEVVPVGMDPLSHFMKHGHRLGYWPNALFDTPWYLKHATDVAALGTNALAHYIRFGWREGRRPSALFDSLWYVGVYPDVSASGIVPLAHFLQQGMAERRDPCALFSSLFYLTEYQDVATAGLNPLVHYLESGAYEGRDPNPYFSSAWYLSRYPEVAAQGRNPLEHYASEGWRKGYKPGPAFDSERYLAEHPDIASANIDPLEHFLRAGAAEQRAQPVSRHRVGELLPSTLHLVAPSDVPVIDVIIPVYRGIEETSRCIESVYSARYTVPFRLIVINDCSPEPAMHGYLEDAAIRHGFTLLVNEENLGFVGTVNRAMALSDSNDVLLLNSDTEVANDWLDRMVAQAYARDRIATVTPLSNNATICSYPDFQGRRTLSPGVSLHEMDAVCATANRGRYVGVPTGVGFCMLIRRAALNELGLFDAEAFGKGYGEENDFCMRAAKQRWENILTLDTFVYHAGEVSFAADSSAGKSRGTEALLAKHPRYLLDVAAHISEDPGRAYRAAITAQLWRAGERPVILLVTHSLGGGTERHVKELAARYARDARVLVLRPSGTFASAGVALQSVDDYDAFSVNLDATDEVGLLKLFSAFPISRIHVHHLFGFGPELGAAIRRSRIPFDFTAHDFFTVCPQVGFTTNGVDYCGEPGEDGCNACILASPKMGARDIRSWRHGHEWVLRDAQRVITPSVDASMRIARYAPEAHTVAIRHEAAPAKWGEVPERRRLASDEALRIAIIGVLAPNKGRDLVIEAAMHARSKGLPLEFVVIGDPFGELPPSSLAAIRTTGRYKEAELQGILAQERPDLVLFASRSPETYSYTLSAAFDAQLPVMVPDMGAFGERIDGRPWSFIFPAAISGNAMAEHLAAIRADHFVEGAPAPARASSAPGSVASLGPDEGYAGPARAIARMTPPARLNVLAVLENHGDVPSPCAHIRLVPFFDAMHAQGIISVRYIAPQEVDLYDADVIITHRVPVATADEARALCDAAAARRVPLIYDLDDNLYDLDPLAEGGKYHALLDVVHTFVERADELWASTPTLAARLRDVGGRRVMVHRNQLDPALWRRALVHDFVEYSAADPVRIVYMGTRTHGDDLAMVDGALKELKRRHGARVEIIVVGVRDADGEDGHLRSLSPPATVGASYPAFVAWLVEQRFDIGISPLRATSFNQCKSEIKVLDYSALGIVPVVSDLEPYHDMVAHGTDGFLVADDTASWLNTLDALITDSALRRRVSAAAHKRDVAGLFSSGVADRYAALQRLVDEASTR
ncbi:glycosyltransferase [Luteibacter aegosomatissinici]|uniref:glycosyltransferase n=1 Tax=Luteibacter aegosomatissinici TaxID=2911539 RepID=UPI001FFC1028|nr:glycosyltransferase [Luteibacter aegosomatissinici]UPG95353.1 glycosyltransferase [Luteibacter aegosomatissinici]